MGKEQLDLTEIRERALKPGPLIYVIRHGETNYGQGIVDIQNANDLTPRGTIDVTQSGLAIAESIPASYSLRIISSPYGRALHTAKILVNTIISKRPEILSVAPAYSQGNVEVNGEIGETQIDYSKLIESSGEVIKSGGFKMEYVFPLITGGTLEFGDNTIKIDPKLTNPDGYDYNTYMVTDTMKIVAKKMQGIFPEAYLRFLESVETFESVSSRMLTVIQRVVRRSNPHEALIIVTHGSLMGFLSYVYSRQFLDEIKPGQIVALQVTDGKVAVTKAGDLQAAQNHIDLFEEFEKYFKKKI